MTLVTYCPTCEASPDADPRYLVVDYCAEHTERPVGVLDGLVQGCWWYGPGEVTGESQRAWCRLIHGDPALPRTGALPIRGNPCD